MKKIILYFLVYTFFFLAVLFFLDTFFFQSSENTFIEENYIEKSKSADNSDFSYLSERDRIVSNQLMEKEKEKIYLQNTFEEKKAEVEKIVFAYKPEEYQIEAFNYQKIIQKIITSSFIDTKVSFLHTYFYKEKLDIRWKFEKNIIKLFWVTHLWYGEASSVFIHEFGHYIDLYYLLKEFWVGDTSNNFYDISWEDVKVIKKWQWKNDFVSGYAMTNKYEDFAETFTYYVFHNAEFKRKTVKSEILESKYNFISSYVFEVGTFKNQDFSTGEEKEYYWDITKKEVKLENFLQYLEK